MSKQTPIESKSGPSKPDLRLRAPKWLPWLFVIAIAGAAFGAYGGTLDHGFTNWDDNWLITENRHIRGLSWQHIQTMLNPMAPREELGNEYLPLRDLSYAVNYALDGYTPRAWHATNLLLHVFNALLVMLLASRLTGRRWIGGIAGLLFAVLPVHVETVAWLSSRKDLLATFFLLGSANLYLAARTSGARAAPSESLVRRVRESKRVAYALSLLLFAFALMSKMTAVVLPALLLLIELFRAPALHAVSKPRKALIQAPFWGVALVFTALASHIGSGLMREPYGKNRVESLLTATSALTRDFQVLLAGYPLHAAVDIPVQAGFTLPVILGALILVALLALGVNGLRESRKGDWDKEACMAWSVLGFASLWFLAALSPVSNFIVQIGTVFAERYLYIPSIGIVIALATLAVMAVDRLRSKPELRTAVQIAGLVVLAGVTGLAIWRTQDAAMPWGGSRALWTHALAIDPGNHVAYFNLARDLEDSALNEPDESKRGELLQQAHGQYENALANPARTYRNDPARVLGAMAVNQVHRGNAEKALPLLVRAREHIEQPWRDDIARADIEALLANPRGLALSALGRHEEAVAAFEEALASSQRYQGARINIASELARVALGERIDEAKLTRAWSELAEYERVRGRDELSIEARARIKLAEFDKRLAVSGKGGGKEIPAELKPILDESRSLYRELVELRAQSAVTPSARASTLLEAADAFARGSPGDATAEKFLREALHAKPDYLGLNTLLAQLLFEREEHFARVEANKLLAQELRLHPRHQPALALKAAGLRQTAVNEITKLQSDWRAEYAAAFKDDNPTLEALIARLSSREAFRKQLFICVALLREAINTDPANDEGHNLIEGSGSSIALAMWVTRDPELRASAEELLRTAFNARSVDGWISRMLTEFYTQLAEQVINRPERKDGDAQRKREDLDGLLENMLKLSEGARRILSRKLYRIGDDVERDRLKLKDVDGKPLELSEGARRTAASEFIKAATLLNPENVEALDWLKKYYEDEGNLDEALKVFNRLLAALGDRPELMHGVNLSLAQMQLNFGEQLLRSFKHKLKLGQEAEAAGLRAKAVNAYLDVIETTGRLIDNPQDAEKISNPISLRGAACQRLAYLVAGDAEKYYTIALQAYERAPTDFREQINEVRKKRSWFYRDPYKKLAELKQIRQEAQPGKDISDIIDDILNVQRRIAQIEAEELLAKGQPQRALEGLREAFKTPTPELYAVRGRIHLALAQGDKADEFTVPAAKDLVRGTTDADALVKGAELYWSHEALRFEEDRVTRARTAWTQAEELVDMTLAAMDKDDPKRPRMEELRATIRGAFNDMGGLAEKYLVASKAAQEKGELDSALSWVADAVSLLGDSPVAWRRQGQIQRALADRGGPSAKRFAADARASFMAALRVEFLLTSQRLELQLDLVHLYLESLKDKPGARNWLDIAQRTLDYAEGGNVEELRKVYQPKLDELKSRAR